jgi:hypothetical protein
VALSLALWLSANKVTYSDPLVMCLRVVYMTFPYVDAGTLYAAPGHLMCILTGHRPLLVLTLLSPVIALSWQRTR